MNNLHEQLYDAYLELLDFELIDFNDSDVIRDAVAHYRTLRDMYITSAKRARVLPQSPALSMEGVDPVIRQYVLGIR